MSQYLGKCGECGNKAEFYGQEYYNRVMHGRRRHIWVHVDGQGPSLSMFSTKMHFGLAKYLQCVCVCVCGGGGGGGGGGEVICLK